MLAPFGALRNKFPYPLNISDGRLCRTSWYFGRSCTNGSSEPLGSLDPCFPIHLDEGSEERIAGVGGTDGEEEMRPFRCNAGQKGKLFDSLKVPDSLYV